MPVVDVRWSDSQEELSQEPSLSNIASPRAAAIAAAAAKSSAAAGPRGLGGTARAAAAAGGSSGHLIGQRYGSSNGAEAPAGSPGFQGWAPAGRAGGVERQGSGRTAAEAWDAAMAMEGPAGGEAATPKLSPQPWQQAQQPPLAEAQQPAAADPLGALQSGVEQPGLPHAPPAAVVSPPSAGGEPRRPPLALKLSATRSLDPDFTRSAEHTGFGESPLSALPNYGALRAAVSPGGSSGPSSARGGGASKSPESVGAALNRSLARLGQQSSASAGSSPQHRQQAPAAAPAQPAGAAQPGPAQRAANGSPLQPQAEPSGGSTGGSPTQPGDARRLRQSGSLKEQAGKCTVVECRACSSSCNAPGSLRSCILCLPVSLEADEPCHHPVALQASCSRA